MKRFAYIIILFFSFFATCPQLNAQSRDAKYVETYIQFVPIAFDLGGEYLGVKTDDVIVDRIISAGIGYVSEILLVNVLFKNVVNETRPDATANNSFPSGHTATAFLGAELVRQEYGWGWGAGAYALATGVGVLRCVHQRHYWWDALAGAGIGVLCANIGKWTREPFKNLFGIRTPKNMQVAFSPSVNPFNGSMGASISVRF